MSRHSTPYVCCGRLTQSATGARAPRRARSPEHHESTDAPVFVDDEVNGEQSIHQLPRGADDDGPAEYSGVLGVDQDVVDFERLAVDVVSHVGKELFHWLGVVRLPSRGTASASPGELPGEVVGEQVDDTADV